MDKDILEPTTNVFYEAPVLLITFNRADNTRKVFDKIREAKIKKLYVANDAPRKGNSNDEINRVQILDLLKEIDWDCELHTLIHETNQGNGFGPVAAYNWFFSCEEMGIILEEDMVPSLGFFEFCNYCLQKYKFDERVWSVSGVSHHSNSECFAGNDYLFTRYAATCAWATWRRCWEKFDMYVKTWPQFYENGGFENVFYDKRIGNFYNKSFDEFYKKPINSWDFRYVYLMCINSGFGIVPRLNLIKNIGVVGAHSNGITESHKRQVFDTFKIEQEPAFVCLNRKYETLHFKSHIRPPFINRYIKRIVGRLKILYRSFFKMSK